MVIMMFIIGVAIYISMSMLADAYLAPKNHFLAGWIGACIVSGLQIYIRLSGN